ncbi:hypothetical protein ACT7DN_30725 [Bacillus paranthracis]
MLTRNVFIYQLFCRKTIDKPREVIKLDGGMVSFVIDEKIIEIPVDTNVVLAHMTCK